MIDPPAENSDRWADRWVLGVLAVDYSRPARSIQALLDRLSG
jgi:hypothetical protein